MDNTDKPVGEIWKDVPSYEGLYQASNMGRIRSVNRSLLTKSGVWKNYPGVLLKLTPNYHGRYTVALFKNSQHKATTVHRVICLTFIPNPENKREVNHKNGIPTDNRVENLEWVTHQENMAHAALNELIPKGIRHGRSKLSEDQVRDILSRPREGYDKLANEFNVSRQSIGFIMSGKNWAHIYAEINSNKNKNGQDKQH